MIVLKIVFKFFQSKRNDNTEVKALQIDDLIFQGMELGYSYLCLMLNTENSFQ